MRPEEAGRTIGPSLELAGVGGSAASPKVPAEGVAPPPHLKSQEGWADLSPCLSCRWRGVALLPCPKSQLGWVDLPPCPQMQGRQAPLSESRGWAQNGPAPMRWSKDLGVHPPNVSSTQQRRCKSLALLFSLFFSIFSVTYVF